MATPEGFDWLILRLMEATHQGKIKWSDTADENSFRTSFKLGTIRLSRTTEYDEDQMEHVFYSLTVLNKEGKPAVEYDAETSSQFAVCSQLFEIARRSARDADLVLQSIIEELGLKQARSVD